MTATLGMLLGLVAGLAAGMVVSLLDAAWGDKLVAFVTPIGTLFINAIRMTVIPLIVAKLIVSVASMSDEGTARRVGAMAFLLFVPAVILATFIGMVAFGPVMQRLVIDPAVAASLRENALATRGDVAAAAQSIPGITEWVVALVPQNVIRAAADGTMLPLIVFSLALGLALSKVQPIRCDIVVRFFEGVADSMVTLVHWILKVAPLGVFALALPLAARLGLTAAGALVYYIAAVAVGCVLFTVLVTYPAAVLLGRVSLTRFAAAALPAQAIALSSRSSLASLPIMIDAARMRLGIPDQVASMFLPIAAALFRAGTALGSAIAVLFLARLYDVSLPLPTLLTIGAVIVVTSFGSPGIPSGGLLVILPVLTAAGIPAEGVGVLLAVDALPDMFRTTANITADMAAVAIVPAQPARPAPTPRSSA
ncbi:MAG: dicarboxylate/amino acid:cation symporter [Gemmatimonadota bacterium]